MTELSDTELESLLEEATQVMASGGWSSLAGWTIHVPTTEELVVRIQVSIRVMGLDPEAIQFYRNSCYEEVQEITKSETEHSAATESLRKVFQGVSDSLVDTMLQTVIRDSRAIADAFGAVSNITHTRKAHESKAQGPTKAPSVRLH